MRSARLILAALLFASAAATAQPITAPTGTPGFVISGGGGSAPNSFSGTCDIVDRPGDGSITSNVLTSKGFTFAASAAVAPHNNIVVMGAGSGPFYPTTIVAATINAGGTNYANNDKSTMSDGTVLEITNEVGGVVQAGGVAIWSSSGENTIPTQPLTQSSTTGSGPGSGLQVTLTFYGQPLVTTITSVNGASATLSTSASNAVHNQRYWYGTDDSAALQAALNQLVPNGSFASMTLPRMCGTKQQLEIKSTANSNSTGQTGWLLGSGRDTSGLYALSGMTAVVHHDTTEGFGGGVANLTIESGALAQYGVYVEGGHNFTVLNSKIQDASGSTASSDIQCGNGTNLVEEFQVIADISETDFNALAPAQRPLRNIQYANNCNDGYVIGAQLAAAHNQNLQFTGGADHAVRIHAFGHAPDYAASQAIVMGSTADTIEGAQIDGSTGGSGLSLGAINTIATNIDCEGFTNEFPGNVPCVNVAAGTPTETVVSGVTTRNSGQTAIAVSGVAVPGLLAIQNPNYIYDPTFPFNAATQTVPACGAAQTGRTVYVTDGGTYVANAPGSTYTRLTGDGTTGRYVYCPGANWIYN